MDNKETKPTSIVRPGDINTVKSIEKLASFNPDIMRQTAILRLMDGPATIDRISRPEIILEGLCKAAENLGMHLDGTMTLISTVRGLSPGLDGLGRGEAVKCLITAAGPTMYPSAPFAQEKGPGFFAKLIAFFSGRKPERSESS